MLGVCQEQCKSLNVLSNSIAFSDGCAQRLHSPCSFGDDSASLLNPLTMSWPFFFPYTLSFRAIFLVACRNPVRCQSMKMKKLSVFKFD